MVHSRRNPIDFVPFQPSTEVEASKPHNGKFSTSQIASKPCNYVANLALPPNHPQHQSMVEFLFNCPIYHALSRDPKPMCIPYLIEFCILSDLLMEMRMMVICVGS